MSSGSSHSRGRLISPQPIIPGRIPRLRTATGSRDDYEHTDEVRDTFRVPVPKKMSSAANAAKKSKRRSMTFINNRAMLSPVRPSLPALTRNKPDSKSTLLKPRTRVEPIIKSSGYGPPRSQNQNRNPEAQQRRHAASVSSFSRPSPLSKRKQTSTSQLLRLPLSSAAKRQCNQQPTRTEPEPDVISDIMGRLQALESQKTDELDAIPQEAQVVQTQGPSNEELLQLHKEITQLRLKSSEKEAEDERRIETLKRKVQVEEMKGEELERSLRTKFSEIQTLTDEKARVQTQLMSQEAKTEALQEEKTKQESESVKRENEMKLVESELREKIKVLEHNLEQERLKMVEKERTLRKLHQEVQELKGNIRVCCRVRPMLDGEDEKENMINTLTSSSADSTAQPHLMFPDQKGDSKLLVIEGCVTASKMEWTKEAKNLRKPYEFEKVFPPSGGQTVVFDELRDLILSAIHGYNVTIVAYGQTGSGKTHTMEGGPDRMKVAASPNSAGAGIIPRAVQLLFEERETQQRLGWEIQYKVSFLEIYNEEPHDLIPNGLESKKTAAVKIRWLKEEAVVEGLNQHDVSSPVQVFALLQKGLQLRSVGATKCNERSSRSHAIFRISIQGSNRETGERVDALLSMVDLAGSENLKESGSEGDRKTETAHINTSLLTLKRVITAQGATNEKGGGKGQAHIPYRESQLTMLLRNALGGGSSKTLIIATVSPLVEHLEETRRTLDFAVKASNVRIGIASKNTK